MTATLVQPKQPFSGNIDGESFVLNPSDILRSDDPIVQQHADEFKPVEPTRQRPAVEQATAAPGELRGDGDTAAPRRRAKKA